MLNVNRPMMIERTAPADEASFIDIGQITGMMKRRWRLIVGTAAVLIALGVVYLVLATPMFMAESVVIIDTQTSQAMQRQDLTDASTVDTSLVDSQVEIINSDSVAVAVVRKLGLARDAEFVGPPSGPLGALTTFIGNSIGAAVALVSGGEKQPDDPERRAVDVFKKLLTVKRTGLTYVITIDFWSQDKTKAATIANAVAESYIASVLDARFAATRRTSDWLEGRLQQIRREANDADQALQLFKSAHNIVDTNRGLMNEQQLAEMNTALANAHAATAEAKARLDRATDVSNDPLSASTVSDALNNPVISRLRAQFLDLSNRASDIAARYGQNHRAVVDLRAQMAQIKKSVQDELQRISAAYDSDYKIAQAREQSLQNSMNKMVTANDSTSLDKVKLQDLESTADSLRALYNGYLQRFQEATQRESFPIADARVITVATPPLKKSSPKSLIVVAGATSLGLLLGLALAFTREIANSFVTAEDVESHTGLPCLGVLPAIPAPAGGEKDGMRAVERVVLDAPFSRYAETIRNIKISVDTIQSGKTAQVIAITSAVPNEGKTTVSLNLAQMIANYGNRVLLIDGDLSSRRLTERFGQRGRGGLLEVLANPADLAAMVQRDARTGLDFLPCASDAPIPHRAELLASNRMAEVLEQARARYQYIILDIAPIVPVVDAKAIARMVDCFVMVIDWRQTSRRVVAEALGNESIHQRTVGAVLNRVDPAVLRQMESYKGPASNNYYIDDKLA